MRNETLPPSRPALPATVLLVEDDEAIREAFRELLELEGFSTCVAHDGRHALDLLGEGLRPDAILLDMLMPTMDGFAFLAHCQATPELAPVPVVVVSATQVERPCGVRAFLKKPCEPSAVVSALRRCLTPRQPSRPLPSSSSVTATTGPSVSA